MEYRDSNALGRELRASSASAASHHAGLVSSKLCDRCLAIVDSLSRRRGRVWVFDHYNSENELIVSARRGCCLCAQFATLFGTSQLETNGKFSEGFDARVIPTDWGQDRSYPNYGGGDRLQCLTLAYQRWSRNVGRPALHYQRTLDNSSRVNNQSFISLFELEDAAMHTRPLQFSQSTRDSLPQCLSWFKSCCESDEHAACRLHLSQHGMERKNPTRLVDIRGSSPRLASAESLPYPVKYATLSHCWGLARFNTLSKDNLLAFHQEIPQDALNKTFTEAIIVARTLGLGFIWIDSLCIMQNDTHDWAKEAGMMSSIYAGAELNIAATSAPDGTGGLFWDRESTWHCQIIGPSEDASKDSALFQAMSEQTRHPPEDKRILDTRAWVFQERFLSRRILHFYMNQVFWECRHLAASELFPSGYPQVVPHAMYHSTFTPFMPKVDSRHTDPSHAGRWKTLVSHYSGLQLTQINDKLAAVAGVAKFFASDWKTDYVCGLWREDLEVSIGWRASGGDTIEPPVAPSWSWASTHGAVVELPSCNGRVDDPKTISLVKVQEVVFQDPPDDPFLGVVDATLRLRCRLLLQGTLHVDEEKASSYRNGRFFESSEAGEGVQLNLHDLSFDSRRHRVMSQISLYLLPLHYRQSTFNGFIDILLLQDSPGNPGHYRRIGHCQSCRVFKAGDTRVLFSALPAYPGAWETNDSTDSFEVLVNII